MPVIKGEAHLPGLFARLESWSSQNACDKRELGRVGACRRKRFEEHGAR